MKSYKKFNTIKNRKSKIATEERKGEIKIKIEKKNLTARDILVS